MIGAIVGDIIGSRFEFFNTKSTDFPLFVKSSKFTDDTVLTVAIADAILNDCDFTENLQKFGRNHLYCGFCGMFLKWVESDNPQPYNSWGNGSGMRVSAVGWLFDNPTEILEKAKQTAEVTHNHPQGIIGAQAIAYAIYLARNQVSKSEIKHILEEKFNYNLSRKLDEIRPTYKFHVSCQKSVPESIIAFLESEDFESAIRLGISLGGDSDTIACMAGSIAEAYYQEIPPSILKEVRNRLSPDLLEVINQFQEVCSQKYSDYKNIISKI